MKNKKKTLKNAKKQTNKTKQITLEQICQVF